MSLRVGIFDKRERKYKCNTGEVQKASCNSVWNVLWTHCVFSLEKGGGEEGEEKKSIS